MPPNRLPLNNSTVSPDASDAPVAGRYAVVRVTFSNPDTGYAVVVLTPADEPDGPEIVAVGDFGAPAEGEVYNLEGVWKDDPRYGRQVRVQVATPAMPSSLVAACSRSCAS